MYPAVMFEEHSIADSLKSNNSETRLERMEIGSLIILFDHEILVAVHRHLQFITSLHSMLGF
jgi:hypothetical protein